MPINLSPYDWQGEQDSNLQSLFCRKITNFIRLSIKLKVDMCLISGLYNFQINSDNQYHPAHIVTPTGLEPATSSLTGKRALHLLHEAIVLPIVVSDCPCYRMPLHVIVFFNSDCLFHYPALRVIFEFTNSTTLYSARVILTIINNHVLREGIEPSWTD